MHRDPGDALFSGAGRGAGARAPVLALALTLNAALGDPRLFAALGALALFGLFAEGRRIAPVLLLAAASAQGLLVAALIAACGGGPLDAGLVLARAVTGAAWCAYFAATVSWGDPKHALRRVGVPRAALDGVDLAVAQAIWSLARSSRVASRSPRSGRGSRAASRGSRRAASS